MDYQSWSLVLFLVLLMGIVGFMVYILLTAIRTELQRTPAGTVGEPLGGTGRYDVLARYGTLNANEDLLVLRQGKRAGPFVQVRSVRCGWSMLWLTLHDGRVIGAPLARYPQLAVANWCQRQRWELRDAGSVIVWPALEFQVSARRLLGHEDS